MNIIIVDDDSLVADALKTILEINEDVKFLPQVPTVRKPVSFTANINLISCLWIFA